VIQMLAAGKQPPENVRGRSKLGQKRRRGKENESATPAGNEATADHTRDVSGRLCSKAHSGRLQPPDLPTAAHPVAGMPPVSPAQHMPAAHDSQTDSEAETSAGTVPVPLELRWHPDFVTCSPAQRAIVNRWFTAMKLNVGPRNRTPHPERSACAQYSAACYMHLNPHLRATQRGGIARQTVQRSASMHGGPD
jgi:hypothetical protein